MEATLPGGCDNLSGLGAAPLSREAPLRYEAAIASPARSSLAESAQAAAGRESPGRKRGSLDTLQTSRSFADEFDDADAVEKYLLWRQQVYAALVDHGEDLAAGRWAMCGDQMPLFCGAGHERWGAYRCELPFCPECAHAASKELQNRWLSTALSLPLPKRGGYRWSHVILTLRAGSTQLGLPGIPLTDEARVVSMKADYGRILKCWAKLRNRWKRRHPFCGGFASREVGEDGNVHLHVVAQLPYIDQAELSREWEAITGDSFVVWIGECFDRRTKLTWSKASRHQRPAVLRAAVTEACKYVTKLHDRDPEELVRIFLATRGTPRGRPWGKVHGKLPRKEKRSIPCPECGDTHWFTGDGLRWLERAARAPPDVCEPSINWGSRDEKQLQLPSF